MGCGGMEMAGGGGCTPAPPCLRISISDKTCISTTPTSINHAISIPSWWSRPPPPCRPRICSTMALLLRTLPLRGNEVESTCAFLEEFRIQMFVRVRTIMKWIGC